MMKWNKLNTLAAMVCAIALVGMGSGWLARGSNPAPEPADTIAKEIAKIHDKLDRLAKEENGVEERFHQETMETRLQLDKIQVLFHINEREWEFDRQQEQERIKAVSLRIAQLEEQTQSLNENDEADKKVFQAMEIRLNKQHNILNDLSSRRRERERQHFQEIHPLRKGISKAEYDLHRIESRFARTREVMAVKRKVLLARLEQLEGQSVGLEPTDRLRDVERKLDSLRREVGELRHALERQGKDARKKSE